MQLSVNQKSPGRAKKDDKDDIFTLTDEISVLLPNCKLNKSEILNKMSRIFFILRDLSVFSDKLILEPQLNKLFGCNAPVPCIPLLIHMK